MIDYISKFDFFSILRYMKNAVSLKYLIVFETILEDYLHCYFGP